jgi:hypothetical protein
LELHKSFDFPVSLLSDSIGQRACLFTYHLVHPGYSPASPSRNIPIAEKTPISSQTDYVSSGLGSAIRTDSYDELATDRNLLTSSRTCHRHVTVTSPSTSSGPLRTVTWKGFGWQVPGPPPHAYTTLLTGLIVSNRLLIRRTEHAHAPSLTGRLTSTGNAVSAISGPQSQAYPQMDTHTHTSSSMARPPITTHFGQLRLTWRKMSVVKRPNAHSIPEKLLPPHSNWQSTTPSRAPMPSDSDHRTHPKHSHAPAAPPSVPHNTSRGNARCSTKHGSTTQSTHMGALSHTPPFTTPTPTNSCPFLGTAVLHRVLLILAPQQK